MYDRNLLEYIPLVYLIMTLIILLWHMILQFNDINFI
jgi:hypothetical protein